MLTDRKDEDKEERLSTAALAVVSGLGLLL